MADIEALYTHDTANQSLLRRAVELPALPDSWRDYFRKRLREPGAPTATSAQSQWMG